MFVINIIIVNINVKKYVMLVRKTLKKNVRKKLNIFNKNVYILQIYFVTKDMKKIFFVLQNAINF